MIENPLTTHKEDCFHLGVKALIRNDKGQILLLQLDPKKCKVPNELCWDLPGGRIQQKESLEDALRREVYEETALQSIITIRPFSMVLSPIRIPIQNADVGLIFATYTCELEGNPPIHLSDEHVAFAWFEPGEVATIFPLIFQGFH